jgi:cell division septum initiation protein DivIVA
VTDSRLKGRVKGLFAGATADMELPHQAYPDHAAAPAPADPDAERQALQVLILARRTAEEHVAQAQQEAAEIVSQAQAQAAEIAGAAATRTESARQEATKLLSEAQAQAAQAIKDIKSKADEAQREKNKILTDAQAKAAQITKNAQAKADQLERDAQQQHQDIIGSLETKRTVLQQQIEAVQAFEQDHRSRLATFMLSQLRSLGVDEAEIEQHLPAGVSIEQAQADEDPKL